MEEIRRLWQEEWAAQGLDEVFAEIRAGWHGLWQAIAEDPARYAHIPYGWACVLIYIFFWRRRKKKFRTEYGLEIARGKYFWLRLAAGMTMMAPGVFGQFFFTKTFNPIWEGPYRGIVWLVMAAPFCILLAAVLLRDMRGAGVPIHLQVTTVIYSYMSTIMFAYVWLFILLYQAILFFLRILHGASPFATPKTSGYGKCPRCGSGKGFGPCPNCGLN